jgi:SSS family solute:Na+ symporter
MTSQLAWPDYLVIVAYCVGTIIMGVYFSRRQTSDDEYFLGGRRMPWFAVGLSVIATLLSSLTYLSEPGEVWKSGVINVLGKMLAIPLEVVFVWVFCIPFLMRFNYTSAYEYLEDRFGRSSRWLAVAMFSCLVILWMGLVVLASSRALAQVTGFGLGTLIVTVGVVATIYTVLGGLRAVIWTDVVQVVMMLGGAILVILFVASTTDSGLGDWYQAAKEYQAGAGAMQLVSFDPYVRSTMLTVALSMFVWHISTHTANQMTVQRYFSTSDMRAARRSFLTGSAFGVLLNLVLMVVGLAILYYYVRWLGEPKPGGLDPKRTAKDADLIFPLFVVSQLQSVPGLAGGIMAAMLAAAMSSIDSAINSLATVLSVERRDWQRRAPSIDVPAGPAGRNHVRSAQRLTLVLGLAMTATAYGLDLLPNQGNIVKMMPKTFNGFIGPLGGLFFAGMFLPRAGNRAALAGTVAGLATSFVLGYGHEPTIFARPIFEREVSFTLVVPGSLLATLLVAALASLIAPSRRASLAGLTWFTRHDSPDLREGYMDRITEG